MGWRVRWVALAVAALAIGTWRVYQPSNYVLDAQTGQLRFTDLRQQDYPLVPALLQELVRPFADWLWPLTPAALMVTAQRRAGLDDYGDTAEFLPAFDALLHGMRTEARLSPLGRFFVTEHMLSILVGRLQIQQLLLQHGEVIARENITAPLIIAGLGRSGRRFGKWTLFFGSLVDGKDHLMLFLCRDHTSAEPAGSQWRAALASLL